MKIYISKKRRQVVITFTLIALPSIFNFTALHSAELPPANLTGLVVYDDGRALVQTDLPSDQYRGAKGCTMGWYQLDSSLSERVYAGILTAYTAGYQVMLLINDYNCSSGEWPMVSGFKIVR